MLPLFKPVPHTPPHPHTHPPVNESLHHESASIHAYAPIQPYPAGTASAKVEEKVEKKVVPVPKSGTITSGPVKYGPDGLTIDWWSYHTH